MISFDKACRSNDIDVKIAYLRENGVEHGLDNELLKFIPIHLLNEYWARKDSNINLAITAYVFDKEFKSVVQESIQDIEISLKQLGVSGIYKYSKSDNPLENKGWINNEYNDEEYKEFKKGCHRARELAGDVSDYYIVSKMSFGPIKLMYKISNRDIRRDVVSYYSMLSWNQFISLFNAIHSIRNKAAHYERLWNRDMKPVVIPKKEKFNRLLFLSMVRDNPAKERKIYNVLVWMIYFLGEINPQNTLKHDLLSLMNKYKNKGHNYDKGMGFPDGWRELDFWK